PATRVPRSHARGEGRRVRRYGQDNRDLVQATLGKRTGRKRKRGAANPRRRKGVDPHMTEAALRLTELEAAAPSHYTVMAREAVAALNPRRGDIFLDATAGAGGHSEALLEACNEVKVIAFDRDPLAVARTRERLARFGARAQVVHLEFAHIEE